MIWTSPSDRNKSGIAMNPELLTLVVRFFKTDWNALLGVRNCHEHKILL